MKLRGVALGLSLTLLAPGAAWADGGASTRNIILGGAAAAGTLLIINHNNKVHERYAEDDQHQAVLQSSRDDARAAYAAERSAYDHQTAINGELQKEVALQHQMVVKLERELAAEKKQRAAERANDQKPSHPIVSYGWGTL